MNVSDFDFHLPPELIAQEPIPERGASRLLVLDRQTGARRDSMFRELPDLLRAGDLLVLNDTRVLPARLIGHRLPGGGAVECLLLERVAARPAANANDSGDEETWTALVHPGQRLRPGSRMEFGSAARMLHGEIVGRHFHGRRTVRLWTDSGTISDIIDAIGHVPLPPYIKRDDEAIDRERYQTIYAHARGSIAAPTAGLHFTDAMFDALAARGVARATITLHVGYGTFQPIRGDRVDEHRMEAERYEIPAQAAAQIRHASRSGRRIIAVGTTTTRALESWARGAPSLEAHIGTTDLFIHPGFEFRVISGLITNFHLPKSSLLMLVSAFAGRERVLAAYQHAIDRHYRFYSYGDAMLVL